MGAHRSNTGSKPADFLLLNVSNMAHRPIFPYAFVQVSEVASRYGITVRRADLTAMRRDLWRPMLQQLLDQVQPAAIGIHLRQCDSLTLGDYLNGETGQVSGSFFPVQESRDLVRLLRDLTAVPVIIGGIGFSSQPVPLLRFIEADYGVVGAPEDFFAQFHAVLCGRSPAVAGLIDPHSVDQRDCVPAFYPPARNREYDEAMVGELTAFYGHGVLYGASPPTVAVEISRGCPFTCSFCTESQVKGRTLMWRDLDTVMAEVEFLISQGLYRYWFICSELNAGGTVKALELAARMITVREKHGGLPLQWSAYGLPSFTGDDLDALCRSGYVGAMNDILSLDDTHLRRARVPYRAKQAVSFLASMRQRATTPGADQDASVYQIDQARQAKIATHTPSELGQMISLFLGTPESDQDTLWKTLARLDQEDLLPYQRGVISATTRIFDRAGGPMADVSGCEVMSFQADRSIPYDPVWPSYYTPSFLRRALGDGKQIHAFLRYVADVMLSDAFRDRLDWVWFLCAQGRLAQVSKAFSLLGVGRSAVPLDPEQSERLPLETLHSLDALLHWIAQAHRADYDLANGVAKALLHCLAAASGTENGAILGYLGLAGPQTMTSYRVARALARKGDDANDLKNTLLSSLRGDARLLISLQFDLLVFTWGVRMTPQWNRLLFSPDDLVRPSSPHPPAKAQELPCPSL